MKLVNLSVLNLNKLLHRGFAHNRGGTLKKEMTALNNLMFDLPKNALRSSLDSYKTRFENVILESLVPTKNHQQTIFLDFILRFSMYFFCSLLHLRLKKINTLDTCNDLKAELEKEVQHPNDDQSGFC